MKYRDIFRVIVISYTDTFVGGVMKKWFSEFASDMRHIWDNFRNEIAEANASKAETDGTDCKQDHSVDWNNVPDLDTRKSVNNLDNPYTRDMRGTDL